MSAIERYLTELGAALHIRGRARRRFLRECRDHLVDASAEQGEEAAVGAFGPAPEIAAALDAEVASRRGVRSTFAAAAGVLATGGSTLVLINAASPDTEAPVAWAIAFFVAAQLAAVSGAVALLQALVLRRSTMSAADAMLLARRNGVALAAAGVTMFSAGAAVPGQGSAVLLLAGPATRLRRAGRRAPRVVACPPARRLARARRPPAARRSWPASPSARSHCRQSHPRRGHRMRRSRGGVRPRSR